MNDATDPRIADLLRVLEISRHLVDTTDLQELLQRVEQAALHVLECERATVFVHDRNSDELFSRVATGVDEIRFPAAQGIAGECFRSGEVCCVNDAQADARFNPDIDRRTGFSTRNLLSCPLVAHDGTPLGVLQVLNKRDGGFSDWDRTLASTFGAQCGIALQRQLLLEEYAEKQRLQRDLKIARTIQQGLLPAAAPEVDGLDMGGWNRPADETGGDFFDYFALPDGRVTLVLADVTGHGIGPALVAAECRALLRALYSSTDELTAIVTGANRVLSDDLPDDRFVTTCCGLIHPDDGSLEYISAGHGPLLLLRGKTNEFAELPVHGLPLGVTPDIPYTESERFQLAPGDIFIALTDGFYEWEDAAGNAVGTEAVCQLIRRHRDLPATEILEQVYQGLQEISPVRRQLDDVTGVLVKRLPEG